MSCNLKTVFAAAAIAAGALFTLAAPANAAPAIAGMTASGPAGIAADASIVTEVRRRGRRWRHRHRWGGPGVYFGFGAPYYYGYPYYVPRPRYRRHYRGGGRCARAHRACVARWGYGGGNYDGCMRYENCRPR